MISVTDPSTCCGCSACADACPVGCIKMHADAEGFVRPEADGTRCVGCGRCERVCPFLNPPESAGEPRAFAAKALDDGLRLASSSGGAFSELARPVLAEGGIVYGVAMDPGCRSCSFVRAEGWGELAPMRGSKYLQADAVGVYRRVEADLRAGRRVLFSGTPCQANALANYLGRRREGLLLVDCVCHGVPSPELWAGAVADLEAREGMRVSAVDFRCKEAGWRRFGLEGSDGARRVYQPQDESPYLRMFLRDVCLRESCYSCRAKGARAADVTIADFWGVEQVLPEASDDLGVSLVIVRTDVGMDALTASSGALGLTEAPYAASVRHNPAEFRPVARPSERDAFFRDLDALGYVGVARRYGTPGARERVRRSVRAVLARVGLLDVARRLRGPRWR